MSTLLQRGLASDLLIRLGDECPSSLRMPLLRVREGTEEVGTASGVLELAREFEDGSVSLCIKMDDAARGEPSKAL